MALEERKTRTEDGDLEVTVLRFGGKPQKLAIAEGTTVEEAIEEAGYTIKPGDEITVNTEPCDDTDVLVEDLDQIVLTPKYDGGCK